MDFLEPFIHSSLTVSIVVIIFSFIVLFKSADIFVESAVGLAYKLKIPQIVIGIVLVSLATTAPELSVSLTAALKGSPEMALGNAIGSVICDDGLALGLAGLFAASPILINPSILKSAGLFLIIIQLITFLFVAFDHSLTRGEGIFLVLAFAAYMIFLFKQKKPLSDSPGLSQPEKNSNITGSTLKILAVFFISLVCIIISSSFAITSATAIALFFNIPEAIIALTLVAFGTSVPEIATCITAARKGRGEIAVGNILGADIMNICWVAGASAIANDLPLSPKETYFMFPSMFIIVGAMLIMLRLGYNLTRKKGIILLLLYIIYIAGTVIAFPPGT